MSLNPSLLNTEDTHVSQETKTLHTALLYKLKQEKIKRHCYDWLKQARTNQRLPEGLWRIWLILAGRGFGKTRTGAETLRQWITEGQARRICLLGETYQETRRVMVEGESGLLSVFPPHERPTYIPSRGELIWPNGAIAQLFSAQSYEQLRGPQFDAAWVDELAKFPYAQQAWDQLMFSLRLGSAPKVIVTTTPRPIPLLKQLLSQKDVTVTRGRTVDNETNLPQGYIDTLRTLYGHTDLGAQELEGEMVERTVHALWDRGLLEQALWPDNREVPPLRRIVISIDPAVTTTTESSETGIIVAGIDGEGKAHVLDDLSGKFESIEWAKRALKAYETYEADQIIAEVNNGGDLVGQLLKSLNPHVPYQEVRATRGKFLRAEPIAARYIQGDVYHQRRFPELEAQMRTYTPTSDASPDRLDALVWALTALFAAPVVADSWILRPYEKKSTQIFSLYNNPLSFDY